MAPTTRERATLTLTATTRLRPEDLRALLGEAATDPGVDAGLLTSGGIPDVRIRIVGDSAALIEFALDDLDDLDDGDALGAFAASIAVDGDDTHVRVGGLSKYRVGRPKLYGSIPVGPETILGYNTYRAFLRRVANTIRARDRHAIVHIELGGHRKEQYRR